jgi:hypothetical protein
MALACKQNDSVSREILTQGVALCKFPSSLVARFYLAMPSCRLRLLLDRRQSLLLGFPGGTRGTRGSAVVYEIISMGINPGKS